MNKEIGGPHWQFGRTAYCLDPFDGSKILTTYGGELGILDRKTGSYNPINTGYESHSYVCWTSSGDIYCRASSPVNFPCVIRIHLASLKVDVVFESRKLTVDKGYLSIPTEIEFPTSDNEVSYGYFYPPQNKDYQAPEGELPPLLVRAHGGPTGAFFKELNLKQQYFTSRGFAVLDVNYRGSTGYGKKYRHKLRSSWGVLDIEDCCNGALHLAKAQKVDGAKLCIDGGSAGGYTTLACLTFRDVFKAGASHYGIGDLEILARETHKFESRYVDNLVAPLTAEGLKILRERSPIHYVDLLNCSLALFQGDEDQVVPLNQAEMMYKAVKEKGLPCAYVLFKGEQHGFRKAENIQKALDGEFYFFGRVLGFEPADKCGELKIDNLA